jgi:hypothetical protein
MQQLVRLALALGLRAPRPIDVRAGPGVPAIEKQDASPDVDGLFVIAGEVSIQTDEEELLDSRVALVPFERVSGGSVGRQRVRHRGRSGAKECTAADYRPNTGSSQ